MALMGPCSQRVLRRILEMAEPTQPARTGVREAPHNPGPWGPHTPQPFPQAVRQGQSTLKIRGRSSLHAVSEKCNTIN